MLAAFIEGRRLSRFDAEKLGDHCLPSTVAALQASGVRIDRERVTIDGQHGRFWCCVYWLGESERATALRILDGVARSDAA